MRLSLVPLESRSERGKKDAHMGWTGMASASSPIANINSVDGDSLTNYYVRVYVSKIPYPDCLGK